jgi:hypothetical protein
MGGKQRYGGAEPHSGPLEAGKPSWHRGKPATCWNALRARPAEAGPHTGEIAAHVPAFSADKGDAAVKRFAGFLLLLVVVGCTSTKPVDMKEPRRVVGTEADVRVDAEVYGDRLSSNVTLPLKYDITNHRATPILVADLMPQSTYDPDTHTVTVDIGSEIPGQQFLPRLIPIQPGERKSFASAVHVVIMANPTSPWMPRPNALRLKINFLGDSKPFEKLVAIPERAVHDPQLAEQLFAKWVEGNETVITNSLPMRWTTTPVEEPTPAAAPRRRRGGA